MTGSILLGAIAWGIAHMMMTVPHQHLPIQEFCRSEVENQKCIIAELASTPEQKAQGLMYRTGLPTGYGMVFIRDDESYRSFWMKNTLIPLDILFLDTEKHLVDQTQMLPCTTQPCPSYRSTAPAQYVVEMMSD